MIHSFSLKILLLNIVTVKCISFDLYLILHWLKNEIHHISKIKNLNSKGFLITRSLFLDLILFYFSQFLYTSVLIGETVKITSPFIFLKNLPSEVISTDTSYVTASHWHSSIKHWFSYLLGQNDTIIKLNKKIFPGVMCLTSNSF